MTIAAVTHYLRLRLPLGWRQLRHHPMRLAVAIAGIVVADLLIFVQLGVMGALFETAVTPIRMFKADLLLLSPDARAIGKLGTLPRRRLYQALGVEGVAAGTLLQIGSVDVRSPSKGAISQHASVMVFGVDPDFDGFTDPEIAWQRTVLRTADTALLDRLTRSPLAPIVADLSRQDAARIESAEHPTPLPVLLSLGTIFAGDAAVADEPLMHRPSRNPVPASSIATGWGAPQVEIEGRTVTLLGLYSLGASFDSDGSMIVSDQTFLRLFAGKTVSAVSAILLRVVPGTDPNAVAERLRAALPAGDTQIMTTDGYAAFVKSYMANNTPIGFVFTFGVVIGLIIGFGIVYQILSADVNDHLAEYATLKAMGYTDRYLLGVVFEEALLLAGLGFLPGLILSLGVYAIMGFGTELAMHMPLLRPVLVLGLTLAMCCASGAVATRRLAAADPADVF